MGQPENQEIDLNDFTPWVVASYLPLDVVHTYTISRAGVAPSYDRLNRVEIHVPCVWFKEIPRGLKLSGSRNRACLAKLYGEKSSQWIGKQISLRAVLYRKNERAIELIPPQADGITQSPTQKKANGPLDELMGWALQNKLTRNDVGKAMHDKGGSVEDAREVLVGILKEREQEK